MLNFVIILFNLLCFISISRAQIPAFPGAEGFGSFTPGGRGGKIIEVTNLNPTGKGSFRSACEASGPRIIIFRTGGTISLIKNIRIKNPYVTIAGQTAPGDGICIKGAAIIIETHDVILRGLRIRIGDDISGPNPENRDGIGIENKNNPPYNIIIDHCSISWAVDENVSVWYATHDITFQWCIISEALNKSIHPKGSHSMGMLFGAPEGSVNRPKNISIHHNLFAHNQDRNPKIAGANFCEIINNVIYNFNEKSAECIFLINSEQSIR